MNINESRDLFKKQIKTVEIGLHNYCNRTCTFCPLSRSDVMRNDRNNVEYINKDIFENIMKNLAEIDFDGRIDISRYHEPTFNKKDLLEKINIIHKFIPKALIAINSNADYINRPYIDDLLDNHIGHISLMAYLKNGAIDYNENSVFKRINQICKKINVENVNPDNYKNKEWIKYRLPEIKSTIHARNYWQNGVNRAGSILDINYKRTEPCTAFNTGVFIDYDGTMTICCDMLAPELHNKWIVGNLNNVRNIFKIYSSEYYQEFLTRINTGNFYTGSPCEQCRRGDRGESG